MNNKTLLENLRCIPDFPKKGINFRDVTTLFKSGECIQIMLDELEAIYKVKGITKPQPNRPARAAPITKPRLSIPTTFVMPLSL